MNVCLCVIYIKTRGFSFEYSAQVMTLMTLLTFMCLYYEEGLNVSKIPRHTVVVAFMNTWKHDYFLFPVLK